MISGLYVFTHRVVTISSVPPDEPATLHDEW